MSRTDVRSVVAGSLCVVVLVSAALSQSNVTAIVGGTLIDGTGRPPVRNAVVVLEGNQIKAVGTRGQVSYPSSARVLDGTGKTILPGLIDSQVVYDDWEPE